MNDETKIITVFGSSRPRAGEPDYEEARLLGRELAARGFCVCSGGYGGVMEAASRGAKEGGGRTLGITATFFHSTANAWLDETRGVATWEERLFELVRVADGYVACKGGTGTLVELAVVWEMLNKNVMAERPFAVLGKFWGPILERVREVESDHRSNGGSRRGEARTRLVHTAATPPECAEFLARKLGRDSG
jgi:uncharacterized protein (TIGR00725 family)